jgi:carbonic anhydrase
MRTVEITYRYGNPAALARPRPPDAGSAQHRLNEGARTFGTLLDGFAEGVGTVRRIIEVDAGDLVVQTGEQVLPKQRPFAAVLGCSDARVPIELIFNEGPNDLFVVRVAGNGIGNDVLGSLRYAIDHLRGSLRLIVVLGHSGCGAMSAAVDAFLDPAGYLPLATDHALRSILDRQLIVVQATSRSLARKFGADVTRRKRYSEALIEASIVTNAALTAYTVQQELHGIDRQDLCTVYGVYLVQSRNVWTPSARPGGTTDLAEPPKDLASFVELGEAIAAADRIATLLASE